MAEKSLLPRNWRKRRDAPRRSARFYVEEHYDGWRLTDWAYASALSFGTRRETEDAARFSRAYVKRWGDIDFDSFPHTLEQPLHYDDAKGVLHWWTVEYPR